MRFRTLALACALGAAMSARADVVTWHFTERLAGDVTASQVGTLVLSDIVGGVQLQLTVASGLSELFLTELLLDGPDDEIQAALVGGRSIGSFGQLTERVDTFDGYRYNTEVLFTGLREGTSSTFNFLGDGFDVFDFDRPHVKVVDASTGQEAFFGGVTQANEVPEPQTLAMALLGLGVVGWTARRVKQRPRSS